MIYNTNIKCQILMHEYYWTSTNYVIFRWDFSGISRDNIRSFHVTFLYPAKLSVTSIFPYKSIIICKWGVFIFFFHMNNEFLPILFISWTFKDNMDFIFHKFAAGTFLYICQFQFWSVIITANHCTTQYFTTN
jgi:hypothetical protein